MMRAIPYDIDTLLYDIANYGYIEGHKLESAGAGSETAHMLTDICAEGNIDRVKRVLEIAWHEVRHMLPRAGDRDPEHDCHTTPRHHRHRELADSLAREYMTCRVLADWTGIVHAPAAEAWRQRAATAMSGLRSLSASGGGTRRRPTGPW